MSDAAPYVFAIGDGEIHGSNFLLHGIIAQRLRDAGYKVGPMLWTTEASWTQPEILKFWKEAMARAGITRIDTAYDPAKMRHWYRVWPRPSR